MDDQNQNKNPQSDPLAQSNQPASTPEANTASSTQPPVADAESAPEAQKPTQFPPTQSEVPSPPPTAVDPPLQAQSSSTEPPQDILTTQATTHKSGRKFPLMIVGLAALAVAVIATVAYLFYGNLQLKKDTEQSQTPTSFESISEKPDVVFSPDQIQIQNGNVVNINTSGTQIIIDKSDYDSTGITGFVTVKVSPDSSKICFYSLPPAPQPSLYFSNIDGDEVFYIGDNYKNCYWSSDSKQIAYVNSTQDETASDIYLYEIETKSQRNLTSGSSKTGYTYAYTLAGWSENDNKILCGFEETNLSTEVETENDCQIDLQSGEVTLL